jgi:1,4-dihydroxy-2-naphthoate octaprenyltransferase
MSVLLVHLTGHLADDYFDRDGDRPSQRSLFAGGSGVIQSGSFSPRSVLRMIGAVCALALLLAIMVVAVTGRSLFLPLMVLGLAGGLAYSAPPVRLASTWFGEVSMALLIGLVLPLSGAYFISGSFDTGTVVLGLPIFLFTLESLIAVEFPDMEADGASNKRNLTFRLGIGRSKMVHISVLALAYMVIILEVAFGFLTAGALLLLVTVPLSAYSSWKLLRMGQYDFNVSKIASNVGMTVNGISMAIMLVYVILS